MKNRPCVFFLIFLLFLLIQQCLGPSLPRGGGWSEGRWHCQWSVSQFCGGLPTQDKHLPQIKVLWCKYYNYSMKCWKACIKVGNFKFGKLLTAWLPLHKCFNYIMIINWKLYILLIYSPILVFRFFGIKHFTPFIYFNSWNHFCYCNFLLLY